MEQRATILNELKELNSSLAEVGLQPTYTVPAGYFEAFPAEVMKRIKTLGASEDPAEELAALSPLLSSLSKKMPHTVPAGYFESLSQSLEQNIEATENAAIELETISPLLKELKDQSTYTVPQGYFESFPESMVKKVTGRETKVIAMGGRKWFRYAAAAVMIGFLATTALLFFNKEDTAGPTSQELVKKMMKKVSTDEINSFVESSIETPVVAQVATTNEVITLMKDVSDKEIQDFLTDTQSAEPDNGDGDDLILN
jgi:hypothetical protein